MKITISRNKGSRRVGWFLGALFVLVFLYGEGYGQVQTFGDPVSSIVGETPFLDASTNFNGSLNKGKGLVFPRTDLTSFTFVTVNLDGINFPTAFDGMVVYNTGTGQTLAGQGQPVEVTPGFYFFSNPNGHNTASVTDGKWIRLFDNNMTLPDQLVQVGTTGTPQVLSEDEFDGTSDIIVKEGAITSAKIADGTITLIDLGQMGAGDGQTIKWDNSSSSWVVTDQQGLGAVLVNSNDANGKNIKNLAEPVDAQDAVTKNYLDTKAQFIDKKNQPGGYVGLGADGKIASTYLPAVAVNNVWTVASGLEQFALQAVAGDVAIRTDENKSYIHNGGTAGDLTDWVELVVSSAVTSVNGMNGNVTLGITDIDGLQEDLDNKLNKPSGVTNKLLTADETGTVVWADKTASQIGVVPTANLTATNVQDALETLQVKVDEDAGGDMAKSVYDTNENGIVDVADAVSADAITTAEILNGTITSEDLAANAVETGKIKDGAVTVEKLGSTGPGDGNKVLLTDNNGIPRWENKSNFISSDLSEGNIFVGNSAGLIAPLDAKGSGKLLIGNGTTLTSQTVTGDITLDASGIATIGADKVSSDKIVDGTIAAVDLADMGATDGQVLKWNSALSRWITAADENSEKAIINDLETGGTDVALSAEMGKQLATEKLAKIETFSGDVSGTYDNLQLEAEVVGSTELAADAVSSDKIVDGTIAAADLSDMGATAGQVLKWDATANAGAGAWVASTDDNSETAIVNDLETGGTDVALSAEMGKQLATEKLAKIETFAGDVSGTYDNLQLEAEVVGSTELAADAVSSDKIVDGTIAAADLSDMGATAGQVLKWNSELSSWVASADDNSETTIVNDLETGGTDVALSAEMGKQLATEKLAKTEAFSGDVSGAYDNILLNDDVVTSAKVVNGTIVDEDVSSAAAISGTKVNPAFGNQNITTTGNLSAMEVTASGNATVSGTLTVESDNLVMGTNTAGQVMVADGTQFSPVAISGDATLTSTGALTISNDAVTSAKIADGQVTATKLHNMGASLDDFLQWDGSKWAPASISGTLGYKGSWDASANNPTLTSGSGVAGEYYVVSAGGVVDLGTGAIDFNPGDWAIYNGVAWQRINNSSDVNSVFGRKGIITAQDGDYSWNQIDKDVSSIHDIADVSFADKTAGNILVADGTSLNSVSLKGDATINNTGLLSIGEGKITSSKLLDGTITVADLADAAVETAKIKDGNVTATKLAGITGNGSAGQVLSSNADGTLSWANGLTDALANGKLLLGDENGVATAVTLSGDASLDNLGALTIATDAVNSDKIADGTIAAADLSDMGAMTGQVLKWDATANAGVGGWVAADDDNTETAVVNDLTTGGTDVALSAEMGKTLATEKLAKTETFGGDLSGTYDNLQLEAEVVGSTELAADAVNSDKIADGTIVAADFSDMGAMPGQVLKWDATANAGVGAWVAAEDDNTETVVVNDLITGGADMALSAEMGKTLAAEKLDKTETFAGDLSGTYDNLQLEAEVVTSTELAADAVSSEKIVDGTIAAADLSDMGATAGQVLKWDAGTSSWVADNETSELPDYTVDNAGSVLSVNTEGSGTEWAESVSLSGDISIDATGVVTVEKLQNVDVLTTTPLSGQALMFNGSAWTPATVSTADEKVKVGEAGTAQVLSATDFDGTGAIVIKEGAINELKLAANAVSSAKIADGTIAAADLSNMGAMAGQVLKWDATANAGAGGWVASDDDNTETAVVNDLTTGGSDVALSAEMGKTLDTQKLDKIETFSGDVVGTYDNLQLDAAVVSSTELAADAVTSEKIADGTIAAADLSDMGATTGQVLKWDAGASSWKAADDEGLTDGTTAANTLRWNGTDWEESTAMTNDGTNIEMTGNLTVDGGTLQTSATTLNLFNSTPTTVNLAGAATELTVGSTDGAAKSTFNSNVLVGSGTADKITMDGGDLLVADDVEVNGDLWVEGVLNTPSDSRLKTKIETLSGVLAKIDQLRGVRYEFKDQQKYAAGPQIGLIAQELQQVFPELVTQGADGYLAVNYSQLTGVLVQAIKEQQREIDLLKKQMKQVMKKLGIN